jgi:hypothetical protein
MQRMHYKRVQEEECRDSSANVWLTCLEMNNDDMIDMGIRIERQTSVDVVGDLIADT